MKNKILALCAFIALSFVGVAESFVVNPTNGVRTMVAGYVTGTNVFSLQPVTMPRVSRATVKAYPDRIDGMGSRETVLDYRARDCTDASVNMYQEDDDGETIFLYPVTINRKFNSYDEMVVTLKQMLMDSANVAMSYVVNGFLDPSREVGVFLGSGTLIKYPDGNIFSAGNFFGVASFTPELRDGEYTVPDGFLDGINIQLSRDLAWRFDFPVRSVKLMLRDRETGNTKFIWDSALEGSSNFGYVRSGNMYLDQRFYMPRDTESVLIQITFETGEKRMYDGFGSQVTPRLSVSLEPGGTLVSVTDGMFNEVYKILSTHNLKSWTTNELSVTRNVSGMTFPITTNAAHLFRLE